MTETCPYCGADRQPRKNSWYNVSFKCGTYINLEGNYFQEIKCLRTQRDQLQARLKEAEGLLKGWLLLGPVPDYDIEPHKRIIHDKTVLFLEGAMPHERTSK